MPLFAPITIRGKQIRNRIVLPPMATNLSDPKGQVNDAIIEHYRERSAADLGTVIVEHTYVRRDGRVADDQMGIFSDAHIAGLRQVVEAIQAGGACAILQLTHGGSRSLGDEAGTVWGVDNLAVSRREDAEPTPMTVEEMEDLKSAFVRATERALAAGFDGVQLHGAHGYLLNQFLSPLTNHRQDGYGSDYAGRSRYPLEVVDAVRSVMGDEAILSYRLSAVDSVEGGLTTDETARFAQQMVAGGVDLVDVSGGLGGARLDPTVEGYFVPQARAIKIAVGRDVPVIVTGGVIHAGTANRIIDREGIDLVGIGRALLMDPNWAVKARKSLASDS